MIVQLTKLNCSLQDMESRYVVLAELFSTCLASSHVWKTNSRESHLPLNCVNDKPCSELCGGIWAYPVGGVGNQGTTFKELRVSRVDACMLSPTLGLWMAPGFQTKTWCHDGGCGLYWACAVRREARLDLRSRAPTDVNQKANTLTNISYGDLMGEATCFLLKGPFKDRKSPESHFCHLHATWHLH